jgi:hypothetical protein
MEHPGRRIRRGEDLGRHQETQPDAVYVQTFEEYRGMILDGVARAIVDPANFDKKGLLDMRHKTLRSLTVGLNA